MKGDEHMGRSNVTKSELERRKDKIKPSRVTKEDLIKKAKDIDSNVPKKVARSRPYKNKAHKHDIIYDIISTGSKGNCVIINDTMVDIGVSYKVVKDKLDLISTLLITHIHSDHVRASTLSTIKKKHPHITIIGNYEVHQHFGVDIVSNHDYPVKVGRRVYHPFKGEHSVEVQGFIWEMHGKDIIYATDTSTLEHSPDDKKYDYLFIEANYDEKKTNEMMKQKTGNYNPYLSAMRHLSKQKCKLFYYTHRKEKDSKLIELHQSGRFY